MSLTSPSDDGGSAYAKDLFPIDRIATMTEPRSALDRKIELLEIFERTGTSVLGREVNPMSEKKDIAIGDYRLSMPQVFTGYFADLGTVRSLFYALSWRVLDGVLASKAIWHHPTGFAFVSDAEKLNRMRRMVRSYHPSRVIALAYELAPYMFESVEDAVAAVLADAGILSTAVTWQSDALVMVDVWTTDHHAHFNEMWCRDWQYDESALTGVIGFPEID